MELYDLIIIGGRQGVLACGYLLRRANLKYIISDGRYFFRDHSAGKFPVHREFRQPSWEITIDVQSD